MKIIKNITTGCLLLAALFGCVGEQGSVTGGGQQTAPNGKLYISNLGNSSLLVYNNALGANGNIAPSQRVPDGGVAPSAVFLDSASDPDANAGNGTGVLYVAVASRNEIAVFNNATSINGNRAPDRVISGGATGLSAPRALALDTLSDTLYVSNAGSNTILVFENASLRDGAAVPAETIAVNQPWGLAVDSNNNRLYAASAGDNSILVFDNANSSALLSRTITFSNTTLGFLPRLSNPSAIFLDPAGNRLYVANSGSQSILIFDNADTISGELDPNVNAIRAISGGQTNLGSPAGLYVDTGLNILYETGGNNQVSVFDNASTVNGDLAPNRTISGSATTLNNPGALFVSGNTLYTANSGNGSIAVFNNASTAAVSTPPNRTIINSGVPFSSQGGIAVDVSRDILYAGESGSILVIQDASTMQNSPAPVFAAVTMPSALNFSFPVAVDSGRDRLYAATSNSVLAFNNASTLTGSPSPDATIPGLVGPVGLFVDSTHDLLYVAEQGTSSIKVFQNAGTAPVLLNTISGASLANLRAVGVDTVRDILYVATLTNSVLVYDSASTVSGAVSPDRTISGSLTTLSTPFGIFVDQANDLLYVANSGNNSVIIFNNASTANGNIAPDRTISRGSGLSDQTSLSSPIAVFVDTTR